MNNLVNYFERLENLKEQLRVTGELLENLKSQRELIEHQAKAIELYLNMHEGGGKS